MKVIMLALALLLPGCASLEKVLPARAAIPVECREPMPERPAMPTESLKPDATLDAYVQAAAAEIERRSGYEDQLVTALTNCRKPIKP